MHLKYLLYILSLTLWVIFVHLQTRDTFHRKRDQTCWNWSISVEDDLKRPPAHKLNKAKHIYEVLLNKIKTSEHVGGLQKRETQSKKNNHWLGYEFKKMWPKPPVIWVNNHRKCQDPQKGTQTLVHNSTACGHRCWDMAVMSSQLLLHFSSCYRGNVTNVTQWNVQLWAVLNASATISYTWATSENAYRGCLMRSCCISGQMVNVSQGCVCRKRNWSITVISQHSDQAPHSHPQKSCK